MNLTAGQYFSLSPPSVLVPPPYDMQVFFYNKIIKLNMQIIEAIAKRTRDVMSEKGLTQYALCKKMAVPESSLYNIFYKRQKDLPAGRLFLICDGLDITIQEFLASPLFARENLEID
jgi:DNA-binding Xre family transcriptional regulator